MFAPHGAAREQVTPARRGRRARPPPEKGPRTEAERLPKAMQPTAAQASETGDVVALSFAAPDAEARYRAATMQALQRVAFREDDRERGLASSDMAVLLRSVRASAEPITRALTEAGVPFVIVRGALVAEVRRFWRPDKQEDQGRKEAWGLYVLYQACRRRVAAVRTPAIAGTSGRLRSWPTANCPISRPRCAVSSSPRACRVFERRRERSALGPRSQSRA